ncbi:MAG: DUF4097 family beta strand repeat-containing protein [Candidatus Eiseniibacteriota bacterium]
MPKKPLLLSIAPVSGALLLVLLVGGCRSNDSHVRESRQASAVPLLPQTKVRVEARTADVHLVPSPDDTLRIVTYRRVQSMSERSTEALDNQIRVTMERAGDELILRVREPERGRSRVTVSAGPWRLRRSVEIELTVAVPARATVHVEIERGDIEARDLTQAVTLKTTTGDMDLASLSGEVRCESTSGDIVIKQVRAPVTVRVTSGDVDADEIDSPLTVRATSGDVKATRVRGTVRIETSTGDVEVNEASGTVTVWTSSGDATLDARPDTLSAQTASGDIEARASGTPRYVLLKSSSGTVGLELPPNVGGNLDLQTATGAMSVTSAIDVKSMSRNRLTGSLGGTGTVEVRTSSGDISLSVAGAE